METQYSYLGSKDLHHNSRPFRTGEVISDKAWHPYTTMMARTKCATLLLSFKFWCAFMADLSSQSEAGSLGLPDLGDSIDAVTFEQILEMDDDEDDREFSRSIVFGFFEQAEQTFVKMDEAL